MPVCIILVWFLASTGLANIDKDMKRKIVIGSGAASLFGLLLIIHIRGFPRLPSLQSVKASCTDGVVCSTPDNTSGARKGPVTHIAYIKTHKAASSTIWSILISFALNHNLTIALPASRSGNKLGWPKSFLPADATPPKPDILCYHSRFSAAMLSYMPGDTTYLTSLRDPASQLHSAYNYFSAANCYNMTFEQFLVKADKTAEFIGQCSDYYKWWLMNGQIYDLGLDTAHLSPSNSQHRQSVLSKIAELDEQFSVVLIVELLDESLVVMRDRLNWSTDDVIYFTKNFRLSSKDPNKSLTEGLRSQAISWNWADQLMYLYFKQKLERELNNNPEYYKKEVEILRTKAKLWMTRCVRDVVPSALAENLYLSRGYTASIGTYRLTSEGGNNNKCVQLTMSEAAKVRLLNAGSPINTDVFRRGHIKDSNVRL